jgi:transposase InsO family protein
MTGFVAEQRHAYGVEPICRVLQIAPSTYYSHAARDADPEARPDRWWRDRALEAEVRRVWDENKQVYGAKKVWKQLLREGWQVARCTVERLMRRLGLRGVVRGKPVKTTVSDTALPCPLDRVNRQFHADQPNVLWVSDFTYVSTWQGMVYVAFVVLCRMTGCTAADAVEGFTRQMKRLPAFLRESLTYDRGSEMANFEELSRRLKMDIWFCDPHAPWQRGSNENTNGLLRQFLPKGSDLSIVSQTLLNDIARLLNGRPRETLGWKTPEEALAEEMAKFSPSVALES